MKKFEGTGVALITPFNEDLSVAVESLKKLVNYQIDNRIDYLVVLGTTGESATLNKEEKRLVINTVVEVNQARLPLILGIGRTNTADLAEDVQTTARAA